MKTINIMINGLPGNVAGTIHKHAARDKRFHIIPFSFTGPDIEQDVFQTENGTITLIKPGQRDASLKNIRSHFPDFITIDYTHPAAVDANVQYYCEHAMPFVLGTTGGDRDAMQKAVEASTICAVIAPNMAKQIVGLQAMIDYGATHFPGLFSGYSLTIKESHQSWKADTSGTAKAMIQYFNQLGIPFDASDIKKERDPEVQKTKWGIDEQYLDGHGWHTYTLEAPGKTALFEITHNINGRDIYAEGTLDGVVYLDKKISQSLSGKVFSMIDVLKQT